MFSCEVCGGNGQHLVSCQHYPEWAAELIAALEKERDELREALMRSVNRPWIQGLDCGNVAKCAGCADKIKDLQAQLAQAKAEALRDCIAWFESQRRTITADEIREYERAALRQSVPASHEAGEVPEGWEIAGYCDCDDPMHIHPARILKQNGAASGEAGGG